MTLRHVECLIRALKEDLQSSLNSGGGGGGGLRGAFFIVGESF